MMNAIKNKIDSAAMQLPDFNTNIRAVTKYCWLAAGGLFVCYLYFVGALTFSVVKQQSLAQSIKAIVSQTSQQELRYLQLQKRLSEQYATEQGFIAATTISYATATSRNFAWNAQ